jgi:hypothetical protein
LKVVCAFVSSRVNNNNLLLFGLPVNPAQNSPNATKHSSQGFNKDEAERTHQMPLAVYKILYYL